MTDVTTIETVQDNTNNGQESASTAETLLTQESEATQSTEEQKPEDKGSESSEPNATEDDKDNTSEGAPESYEDFTTPEGVELSEEAVSEFHDLAKELNLTQEQAQKLVDYSTKMNEQGVLKHQEEYSALRESWVNDLKNDSEFGGDKMGETVDRAQRVLKSYGSPKLSEFLNTSGYGDNNELIIFLAKMDRALGEDTVVDGNPSGGTKSAAQVLFNNS